MTGMRQSMGRRALGAVCAAALMVAGAAPAAARGPGGGMPHGWHGGPAGPGWSGPRGGGYRGGPYWGRYRGGWDAGDVIGIAALIGAVAVIANAASRDRSGDYDRNYDRPYDRNDTDRSRYDDRASSAGTRSIVSSDDAANACADAARDEAQADNRGYAQILSVDPAQPYGSADGWSVNGRVEQRASAQDGAGVVRRFSCEIEGGRVAHVYLSRDSER